MANDATFNITQIVSGIPQSTVLGPLLFIVALTDMPSSTQSDVVSNYAYDTKVLRVIQKPENAIHLQLELNAIHK